MVDVLTLVWLITHRGNLTSNREGEYKMLKLFGILVLINAIVIALWFAIHGHSQTKSIIFICTLAVGVGLVLLFYERVTQMDLPGGTSIKTVVETARADANAVSDLRKRVEAQSATVDLVAEEASKATSLVEELTRKNAEADHKLAALDKSVQAGGQAVGELQAYSKFNSTILAAQSDDRKAYDQLTAWASDASFRFQEAAAKAAQTIMDQHAQGMFMSGFTVPWEEGVQPDNLTLAQLKNAFNAAPPHIRVGVLEFTWNKREDIPKKERLEFLVDVLRNDESLRVVEYAGRYFGAGTHDQLKPLAIRQHLEWWEKNKDTDAVIDP